MSIPRRHRWQMGRSRNTAWGESYSLRNGGESLLISWAESFMYAGSSALLLLIAHAFADYWYFSFFALTPFLYRIIKSAPGESLRLGFLLGLSFFGTSSLHSIISAPLLSCPKILAGTALFSLFGWAVGWARSCWGFSPFIVAVLWAGLEMGLLRFGFSGGIFGESGFSNPLLHSLAGLLGLLAVSAIIVVFNSLFILAVLKTLEITGARGSTAGKDENKLDVPFVCSLFTQKVYLVPEGRAPPYTR